MSIESLLEQYGAASLEKQWALSDLLGEHDWLIDLEQGEITFTGEHGTQRFPIQVLGTEADSDGTWLWAWANIESGIPQALLYCCEKLREIGKQNGIPEFTEAEIGLNRIDGAQIALIASGICGAFGFYGGHYEGGAAFVLLDAPSDQQRVNADALRSINVFVQFISDLQVNHRRAFLAYMESKGYRCLTGPGGLIEVYSLQGRVLQASFDELDRLTNIDALVT